MIPRKIHYVWVGGKPLPALAERCLESWRKHLPDFEIKRWDESNAPMDHPYVKAMYEKKMWAFVSDYIRFWVLENEGGVYLDTDTVVLKGFDDELMREAFFGKFSDPYSTDDIACGVIGAPAGHSFIKKIREYYDSLDVKDLKLETSPHVVTTLYNRLQPVDVSIFHERYFNPCKAGEKRTPEKLKDAYTDNLWAESWVSHRLIRKIFRKLGIMPIWRAVLTKTGLMPIFQRILGN